MSSQQRIRELCNQIGTEKDPAKLVPLIKELRQLLMREQTEIKSHIRSFASETH